MNKQWDLKMIFPAGAVSNLLFLRVYTGTPWPVFRHLFWLAILLLNSLTTTAQITNGNFNYQLQLRQGGTRQKVGAGIGGNIIVVFISVKKHGLPP